LNAPAGDIYRRAARVEQFNKVMRVCSACIAAPAIDLTDDDDTSCGLRGLGKNPAIPINNTKAIIRLKTLDFCFIDLSPLGIC